jgi:hypothetical protein
VQSVSCESLCGGDHDLLSMACILAIIVSLLILALQLMLVRRGPLRAFTLQFLGSLATLATPAPPSLHVLSISRT